MIYLLTVFFILATPSITEINQDDTIYVIEDVIRMLRAAGFPTVKVYTRRAFIKRELRRAQLAPPTITEVNQKDNIIYTVEDVRKVLDQVGIEYEVLPQNHQVTFIESRIILTPFDDTEQEITFSIWMPDKPVPKSFVILSEPKEITLEMIELVFDLLKSN